MPSASASCWRARRTRDCRRQRLPSRRRSAAEGRRVSADVRGRSRPSRRPWGCSRDPRADSAARGRPHRPAARREPADRLAVLFEAPEGARQQRRPDDRSMLATGGSAVGGARSPVEGGRPRHPDDLHRHPPRGWTSCRNTIRACGSSARHRSRLNENKYIVPGLGRSVTALYGT